MFKTCMVLLLNMASGHQYKILIKYEQRDLKTNCSALYQFCLLQCTLRKVYKVKPFFY